MDAERLRATAEAWTDDAHPDRDAAAAAFEATGLFTEAQIAFALNEQMTALAGFDVEENMGERAETVRLVSEDHQPLCGLAETIALAAEGWRVELPDDPLFDLTRAFLDSADVSLLPARGEARRVFTAFDPDAPRDVFHPLPVAVLDGKENADTREDLAEDLLLYEGASARCVRVVFAPQRLSPDAYLAACAEFRGRFPASHALRASVRMMAAFARKARLPLAELDDDSLLVTRGAPEAQRPGHVRWVEYADIREVEGFCASLPARVYARRGFSPFPGIRRTGQAHRPGVARFTDAVAAVRAWGET